MINVQIEEQIYPTVIIRFEGEVTARSAREGVLGIEDAISEARERFEKFCLIIDARKYAFTDIEAHRTWKLAIEGHPLVKEHVLYTLIVSVDSETFRAEKESLESERVRFFVDYDRALDFLKANIGV